MSSQVKCVFHPEIMAKTTCARCHRPICLEDIRTIRRSHHILESDSFHHPSYVAIDFCPICYAEVLKFQTRQLSKIRSFGDRSLGAFTIPLLAIVAVVIIMGIGFSQLFSTKSALVILIIPILFFLVFMMMSKGTLGMHKSIMNDINTLANDQTQKADQERIAYLAILERNETKIQEPPKDFVLKCFQCGNRIYPGDQFCANCGDPTTDEMQAIGSKK